MDNKQFIADIEKTYAKGIGLIKLKNADYASSENPFRNFEFANLVGVPVDRGMLIRMTDKLARISNLLDKKNAVKDESIEDTVLDLINYSGILLAYMHSKKK